MTKADWLVLTGFLLFAAGFGWIYRPLALLFAGAVCLLLSRPLACRQARHAGRDDGDLE